MKKTVIAILPLLLAGCIGADITAVGLEKRTYHLEGNDLYVSSSYGTGTNQLISRNCHPAIFNPARGFPSAFNPSYTDYPLKKIRLNKQTIDDKTELYIHRGYRPLWSGVFVDATILPFRIPLALPLHTPNLQIRTENGYLNEITIQKDRDGKSIGFFYGLLNEAGDTCRINTWFMREHPCEKYPRPDNPLTGVEPVSVAIKYFECQARER